MTEPPFDACWRRWDRANEHRQQLAAIWNDYIADHPYDYSLDHEGGGVYVFRVWETRPVSPELAVIMGEWLYNLRSSLDYVVWATAVYVAGQLPPPNEEALQYPIYDTSDAWKRNTYRLRHLAPHHREMLAGMQPFNGDPDANFLGWINRLARIDRHRRLVDGTSYLAELNPVLAVPEGTQMTLQWGERVLIDGRADVAQISLSPWNDGLEIQFNPRVGIDPEIGEWSKSPFWRGKKFGERLLMMQIFVAGEIATYEYDCTGASRKEHLLTDTFRSESDARRVVKPIVRDARPAPKWESPLPGRSSNEQRLLGLDFPSGPASPSAGSE